MVCQKIGRFAALLATHHYFSWHVKMRGRSGRAYANAQEPLPGVSVAQVAEHRGKYHVAHHEGCLQQSQVLVYKAKKDIYLKNSNTSYTVPILSSILYTYRTGSEATRNQCCGSGFVKFWASRSRICHYLYESGSFHHQAKPWFGLFFSDFFISEDWSGSGFVPKYHESTTLPEIVKFFWRDLSFCPQNLQNKDIQALCSTWSFRQFKMFQTL